MLSKSFCEIFLGQVKFEFTNLVLIDFLRIIYALISLAKLMSAIKSKPITSLTMLPNY